MKNALFFLCNIDKSRTNGVFVIIRRSRLVADRKDDGVTGQRGLGKYGLDKWETSHEACKMEAAKKFGGQGQ